jgi:hypothetical protein
MMPEIEPSLNSSSISDSASSNPCLPISNELQLLTQNLHETTKRRQVKQAGILPIHNLPESMYDVIATGKEKDKNYLKQSTLCPMDQFVTTKLETAFTYARDNQYSHLVEGALHAKGTLRKLLVLDLTFDWRLFSINHYVKQNNQFRLSATDNAASAQLQLDSTGTITKLSDFAMLITNICTFAKNTNFWNGRYSDKNLVPWYGFYNSYKFLFNVRLLHPWF